MEKSDIITWSKEYFLNWSDFKAEANSSAFEDSSSYIKFHQTWTVNSEISDGQIYFQIKDIQLSTQFFRHLSWVREKQSSSELLKHEQGHFDLAELVKRENLEKLKNKFYEKQFSTRGKNEDQRKQFAREDSGKMIAEEVRRLEVILSQRRKEYDEQTHFGQNLEKQFYYDSIFDKLKL